MKIPIPQDWSEGWLCAQIEWPDSPQWVAILLGLLELASRGYTWDERTGTITDVQKIGWEIWKRNFPLVDCAGGDNGNHANPDPVMWSVFGSGFEECDDMNCSIPPHTLRWKDGILQYLYCGVWYDVDGSPVEQSPEPPPEGYEFDDDLTGTLSPCGKATNLAQMLVDVAGYFWDNSDNSFYPLIEYQAENATGTELKASYASELWALTLAHKGLRTGTVGIVPLDRDNVLPEDMVEKMACLLQSSMSADQFEDDGDAIDKAVESAIGTILPLVDVDNIAAQAWWYVVKAMVGKAQMVSYANAGAYNTDAECNCYGTIIPVNPSGSVFWQDAYDIVTETQGATMSARSIVDPYRQHVDYTGGQNANFQEVHGRFYFAHPSAQTISELEIWLENRQVSQVPDYFLATNWSDTSPTDQANYTHPVISDVATPDDISYTTSANKLVCVFKWDTPLNLDAAKFFVATKMNPKNQAVTSQIYRVVMTIVYAGAQR